MAVNYFEPGSAIYILKDVPLDITYNHTWYFSTPQEQLDHFRRQTLVKQIGGTQYQRYDNTSIYVQLPMSKLYGANYMYFVNDVVVDSGVDIGVDISGRRLKYFYAFITDVEYVNPNTSCIYYEIDYMQSFMFDYVLGDSFVVREHSETDKVGDNIIEESFGNLPYELVNNDIHSPTVSQWAVIWQDADPYDFVDAAAGNVIPQGIMCGIVNGIKYGFWLISPNLSETQLTAELKIIFGKLKEASVGKAYMLPVWAINIHKVQTGSPANVFNITTQNARYDGGFFIPKYPMQWDRYNEWQPKNKKMYTYPYNKITLFSADGNSQDYAYEHFKYIEEEDGINFSIESNFINGGIMMCLPLNHLNSDRDYTHSLIFSNVPSASFTTDSFDVWFRNNALSEIGGNLNNAINQLPATNTFSAQPTVSTGLGVGVNLATRALSTVVSAAQASMAVDKINAPSKQITMGVGGINQPSDNDADISLQTFYGVNYRIKIEIAKIIDDYFTMFGYATNRVKEPNRNVRSRFTYTQTNGCVFKKINLPQKFANKIASIYDKGITFWKPTATIGDYNSPNNVL